MSREKNKKISAPPSAVPQIRGVIDQILEVMDWRQEDLAAQIGTNQSMVSKMRWGPKWRDHWRHFYRLNKLYEEIREAHNLPYPSPEEVINDEQRHGVQTRDDAGKRKRRA